MDFEKERKDRRTAMLVTGLVHLALVLIFLFVQAFTIEDPPPGQQYVAISMADYGSDVTGSGERETEVPSPEEEEVVDEEVTATEQPVETTPPDEVVTQEESQIATPTSPSETEAEEDVQEEQQQVTNELSNALEQMNSEGGGGGDGEDEETGNEGTEEGNIEGMGVVGGDKGITGDLHGRGLYGNPSVKPQEEGVVVLNVYVDKNGNITRVARNYEASNTISAHLFNLAEEAVKDLKFEPSPGASPTQRGTITFNFQLE